MNRIRKKLSLVPVFMFLFIITNAQHTGDQTVHEHKQLSEIGLSLAPSWFLSEGGISTAVHFHYVYNFPHTKYGIGLGYERIFDEHKHNFIGVEFNYRIIHPLTVSLSPGVAFEGEHSGETDFALHFETVYEFELGRLHIGPMVEIAYHPEDWHLSLGIHLGFGL